MTLTWLLLASTGIVIVRFCKHIGERSNRWMKIHIALLLPVPILSFVGFLTILGGLGWNWVSVNKPLSLAHSIFGIVAISFSIFQVFYS